ncbi:MAG: hypothetical protein D6719_06795 [Candidatus Dadabacteria bacterium]|nr:MAG: hypothetical protein D6719_06795 [Candidatus Dadabacteria bacterium]
MLKSYLQFAILGAAICSVTFVISIVMPTGGRAPVGIKKQLNQNPTQFSEQAPEQFKLARAVKIDRV